MRIVVVEQLAVATKLAPILRARWPNENIAVMPLMNGSLYHHAYPRALSYQQFPLILPADFKPATRKGWQVHFNRLYTICEAGGLLCEDQSFEQASETLMAAEHLVYMGDWDYSGIWGMELLKRTLAPSWVAAHEVFRLPPEHKTQGFQISLPDPIDSTDPGYQALYQAALVKRHFDYNFHFNGLVILGKLYRALSGNDTNDFLGRSGLLTTLRMAHIGDLPEDVTGYLAEWTGTGKYTGQTRQFFDGMGSHLARFNVKYDLLSLEIIKHKDSEAGGYALSQLGEAFVSKIHKDCYDQDLPSRLHAWMERPFEEVSPLIDQYILTYFRKQKRLQDESWALT
jgi:hypothetical protein